MNRMNESWLLLKEQQILSLAQEQKNAFQTGDLCKIACLKPKPEGF